MESELWARVYQIVMDASKGHEAKRVQHSDATIALTFLWAVLHDRPVSWACRASSWPRSERRIPRPSASTMSRRLRTRSVRRLFKNIERRLRRRWGGSWCQWIDARPLPVGACSKDRHAHWGRGASGWAKGYKLYAVCQAPGAFTAWEVMPMNVAEKWVARHLIRHLEGTGYLVGDAQYDSSPLFDVAARHGFQLVAPRQQKGEFGGHYLSPFRVRSIDLLDRPFGQAMLHQRGDIDRYFAQMSNFGGGLAPLPNWVRTYRRVRLWVQAKIIIHMIRLTLIRQNVA